jgi:argininosuccinate lyase
LQTLLVLIKGLPLAYNRDLQEDKPAVFDAFDTVKACLELAAPIVAGAELNRASIAARLDEGFLDATALMEYLVRQGVPMRAAHETVGKLVRRCEQQGCRLAQLALEDLRAEQPKIDPDVFDVLGAANAVRAFTSLGSTAPAEVQKQLDSWQQRLAVCG